MNDNIVITGIGGRFPQCENVEEFKEALLNGVNLVKEDSRRYPAGIWGTPKQAATILNIDKFDASFFGVHPKQATFMDPRHRILLETVYESIIDAGYNPKELRNSKIGVYVGICNFTKHEEYKNFTNPGGYSNIGLDLAIAANRISYCFDFKGPSYILDSACSSSTFSFVNAIKDMQMGETDGAIVCGSHLIQHPFETLEFNRLNMLSPEGSCKVFASNRDGYVRAESVVCYFLQRQSKSRRIYATVCGGKSSSDGFKKEGITYPSAEGQYILMKELYKSVNIDPRQTVYVEAHGTGTTAGDFIECTALTKHFCTNRTTPLHIGAVKSNMGHSEISSGLCSMTKVIIAMETGIIPANLHTELLDKTIPGIKERKLNVITENTKWNGGIVGVNCFGFGGANSHIILDSNRNEKVTTKYQQHKNRLVHVSGRTEEAVLHFLNGIEENSDDPEFLAMVDEIHKINIDGHNYRGYIVLGDRPVKEVGRYTKKRPIWFIYTGMGCQWNKMGKDLMNNVVFQNTINRCAKALEPYGVDLLNIITSEDPAVFDDITNCFCAIGCTEIALTDVLYSLDITPDGICGHSLGEVGCAYADGQITPEQAALLVFARAYGSSNSKIIPGQMAAIGLSKEEVSKRLPEGVFIACQNAANSVTISGPLEPTKAFVEELSSQGVFARLVKSAGIPFHTKYIDEAGKLLLEFCKNVIKDPKPRSSKWISSSVPPSKQNEEWSQLNCAEYHHNNFCNTVLFDQVYGHIPENAIVVEVAPHGLLQAILKKEMGQDNTHISIANRSSDDNEKFFLTAIGKIYMVGGQPQLRNMYNDVKFPVSRGTKMLAPLVKWDHSVSWFSGMWENRNSYGKYITVSLSDEEHAFLGGHEIDGRILMPATGYLDLVWDVAAKLQLKEKEEVPIVFENIKFKRATVLTTGDGVKFLVNIMKQSGNFEIFESGSVVCTGIIRTPKDISAEFILKEDPKVFKNGNIWMTQADVYKECCFRRYNYKDYFIGIIECDVQGRKGKVEWKGKFASFLDTMLHLTVISTSCRDILLPTAIQQISIDPVTHLEMSQREKGFQISFNHELNIIKSGRVEIIGLESMKAPRRQNTQEPPSLETYEFIHYETMTKHKYDLKTSLSIALQIVLQNNPERPKQLQICEIIANHINEKLNENIKKLSDKHALLEARFFTSTQENLNANYDIIVVSETAIPFVDMKTLLGHLTGSGFVLYKGHYDKVEKDSVQVIFQSPADHDSIYLLRPVVNLPSNYDIIHVKNSEFDWLEKLKEISVSKGSKTVYLFSQNETINGLIGFTNCLITEPSELRVRSLFLDGNAKTFSVDQDFYKNQLKKDLTFNVLKNNIWGTYVHLPLKDLQKSNVGNAAVSISTTGDLSTIDWIERPFEGIQIFDSSERVYVYYSALNFKDVMIATGKLASEVSEKIPTALASGLGLEYAGVTARGKRVMGIVGCESLALQIYNDPYFTWEVPERWTLKEACTVPCVYATCYYALFIRGQMKRGESILIHAGTGGIGLAAINIALSMGCQVYTTVSTKEKREFLLNLFPQLTNENIGNSRDKSFEIMVKERTKGQGVDLVLNSLSDELFQASMRCLAAGGRFLEIGKVDLVNSSPIPSKIFLRNISFHGVHLDNFFYPQCESKCEIQKLLAEGIANDVVKPLPSFVFEESQVEAAFRFLASGKHKGKVLIEVRKEDVYSVTKQIRSISAYPKIYFDPQKSYILIGGLGGFGFELVDWMIKKGATKIILNARTDVINGYQTYCFKKWSQLNEVSVKVNTSDTSNSAEAESLIKFAQEMGPVGGIFNMASTLKDSLIVNQTKENFLEVFKSKILSGENMDKASRKMCRDLDYFIVFSSIACGKGNVGQTNYGMANSALERLCEKRRSENLPGLAVQWGPIGEVGLMTKLGVGNKIIYNLIPQKIESCLNVLERFMLDSCVIGCSYILYEKNTSENENITRTPVEVVAHILGIKNLDLVEKSLTLSQLGLDSLMMTEIKQTLYRNFNLEYSPEEIRDLTLNSLITVTSTDNKSQKNIETTPENKNYILSDEAVVKLNNSADFKMNIFLLHPIEGHASILKPLANKLKATAYAFQCTEESLFDNMEQFANYFVKKLQDIQPKGPYHLCGYSYGCALITEMAIQLEQSGNQVDLIYLDGSPSFVWHILKKTYLKQNGSLEKAQDSILEHFGSSFPRVNQEELKKSLESSTCWEKKLQRLSEVISNSTEIDKEKIVSSVNSLYGRIKAGFLYEPAATVSGKILLIRRTDNPYIVEDYDLKKVCKQPVTVVKIDGDHNTILLGNNTEKVAKTIDNFCFK